MFLFEILLALKILSAKYFESLDVKFKIIIELNLGID